MFKDFENFSKDKQVSILRMFSVKDVETLTKYDKKKFSKASSFNLNKPLLKKQSKSVDEDILIRDILPESETVRLELLAYKLNWTQNKTLRFVLEFPQNTFSTTLLSTQSKKSISAMQLAYINIVQASGRMLTYDA